MASVSASHLILFIASMVVAAGVAGTFTNSVGRMSGAIDDQSLDLSKEIRTDVEIISDGGSGVYNRSGDENVTLLVKNTGSKDLPTDPNTMTVLLDGAFQSDVSVRVLDGPAWDRGNVLELTFGAGSLPAGDHRVKLIVEGDEEVFRFRA